VNGIVVLISGRGSNMRAIVEAGLPVDAVISNRGDAAGLEYARRRGIRTAVVEHRAHATREDFEAALARAIDTCAPRLVALAGFMRILTTSFVARYAGRLMNIHPSLLPAFPGLHTHEAALAAGVKVHGATVHFVTPELDHGPIVIQAAVPVLPGDDAERLAARVLAQEHVIYPLAIRWFLEGRLSLSDGRVDLAGHDGTDQDGADQDGADQDARQFRLTDR
jgi:phosphoribosylglycinamide formyltransferase-1